MDVRTDIDREQEDILTNILQTDDWAVRVTADELFPKARRTGWICPVCQNGSGESGTGMILGRKMQKKRLYCPRCQTHEYIIWMYARSQGHSRPTREDFQKVYAAALRAGVLPFNPKVPRDIFI